MAAADTIRIHVEEPQVDPNEYDEEEDDFVTELPSYMKVHQPGKAITSKRGTVRGVESKVANTLAGMRKMSEDRERSEQSVRLMRLLEVRIRENSHKIGFARLPQSICFVCDQCRLSQCCPSGRVFCLPSLAVCDHLLHLDKRVNGYRRDLRSVSCMRGCSQQSGI